MSTPAPVFSVTIAGGAQRCTQVAREAGLDPIRANAGISICTVYAHAWAGASEREVLQACRDALGPTGYLIVAAASEAELTSLRALGHEV